MPLSNSYKSKIVASLSPRYREMYENGDISDRQLEDFAALTGISPPAAEPRRGRTGTAAPSEETGGFLSDLGKAVDRVTTSARGGYDRSVGAAKYTTADTDILTTPNKETSWLYQGPFSALPGSQPVIDTSRMSEQQKIEALAAERARSSLFRDATSEKAKIERYVAEQPARREEAYALYRRGEEAGARAEQLGASMSSGFLRSISEPVADVAGSPSSLASLPGGVFSTIPAADVWNQEYTAARAAGLPRELAEKRATIMAGVEGGISAIPTGGALAKLGGRRAIQTTTRRVVGDVAGTAFKEGVSEAVTTLAQEGANTILAGSDNAQESRYAESRASTDIFADTWRSFKAGMVGGGAIRSVTSPLEVAAENGRRAREVARGDSEVGAVIRQRANERRAADATRATSDRITEINKRLDIETAYTQRDLQQEQDAARKLAEQEAGFMSMERDAALPRDRVERYAGVTERVPVQPAAPLTAEQGQASLDLQAQQARDDAAKVDEAALSPFVKEAQKTIDKDAAAALKRAKTRHTNDRSRELKRLMESTKDMPQEQRARFVASGLKSWTEANPVPTKDTVAPKPAVQQPEQTVAPVVTQQPAQPAAPQAEMSEDAIRQFGLASRGQQTTGGRAEQLVSSIQSKIGSSREAAALGKMVADGKLVLLDDATQLPNYDPSLHGSAGFYDGERMYLMADQLDPENIKGSLMVVAAHEAKHVGDVAGAQGATGLRHFIGEEANARIHKKIVDLAGKGDADAQAAVAAATQGANGDEAIFALELPAYYVSAAMSNRAGKGVLTNALRDIVSSVRTGYKNITGKSDINLNDVGYLANKLVEEIAISNGSVAAQQDTSLQMVVGPGHPAFNKRKAEGKTFVDYDDMEKTLISDDGAFVSPESVDRLLSGTPTKVKDIIDVPAFTGDYALFGDIPIVVENTELYGELRNADNAVGREIMLGKGMLESSRQDPTLATNIVLHELQHAVQAAEDFARGGNQSEFVTKADQKILDLVTKLEAKYSNMYHKVFAKNGQMNGWGLTPITEDLIEKAKSDVRSGAITRRELATEIKALINADPMKTPEVENIVNEFSTLTNNVTYTLGKAKAIRAKTYQKYLDLLGEREARFTGENSSRTQEELDVMVRPQYKGDVIIAANDLTTPMRTLSLASLNFDKFKGASADALAEAEAALKGKASVFTAKNALGQFSGFGVLGRELGNLKELAEGQAASIAYVAEGDYYRTAFGMEKMAKRLGKSVQQVKSDVGQMLKQAADIKDVDARRQHIASYVNKNKELRPLLDALDNIAAQSKAIVAARVRDPRPMTEEELSKYSAIIKNRYNYFTRTFAAFQGREGELRNRRLEREAKLAKAQKAAGKEVSSKYKHAYKIYADAVRFVINNDIGVFDPEMLAKQSLDKLDYLYSLWVGNPEKLRTQIRNDVSIKGDHNRRQAYRALAEAQIAAAGQSVNKDQLEREGEYLVNGLLGLNEQSNPVMSYYRGMKQDRSILKTREDIPNEILQLFGEIEDLPTKIAITLAKQGELASRMRMMATVYENGNKKWFVDPETYRSSDEYARFTEELTGEDWGPLNGMRVTPEIAAALNDGLDIFTPLSNALAQAHATVDRAAEATGNKLMTALRKTSSLQKFIQIVLSPFNTAANFLGSWSVIAQNGGATPDDMLRALKASARMLNNQLAPGGVVGKITPMTRDADLELFLKYTLLDSAVGQELRATPTKFLKKLVVELESATTLAEANKLLRAAADKTGNAKNFVTELFALSDAWVKPAVFLSRVRFLDRINKAEGKGWTQEQIEQQAADMTKDTTITFQRGAPAVKLAERLPLTWYATYIQGVFRSTGYAYGQAAKDFLEAARAQTPEGKLLYALEGAKRLAGATAATTGAAFATKALAQALNDDDDEEYIEAAKKLLYSEGRYGDGIYLGKNEKGNPVFLRLSRLDPNGPVNDMIRIAISDDSEDVKVKAIMEHLKELWIMPRTTADTAKFVASVFTDDPVKNKKTKLERLFPATSLAFKNALPADYGTAEAAIQVVDGFLPGVMNAFDQESATPVTDIDPHERALAASVLFTGGRVDVADPGMASFIAGSRLDTLQKEGRAQIAETLELRGPYAALAKYDDLRQAELDAYFKLKETYDALLGMGYSPSKATAILKDNKVQAQDIALIKKASIPDNVTSLIDADSIMKSGSFQDRGLSEEEAKEEAKRRKDVIKKLELLFERRAD